MGVLVMKASINSKFGSQACRREQTLDRRQAHFKATLRSFFSSRRQGLRRGDQAAIEQFRQQDQPISMVLLFGVVAVVVLDAIVSLAVFNAASREISLAQLLAQQNLHGFFFIKSIVTALCLLFMATYKQFDVFRHITEKKVLLGLVGTCVLMLGYQITLLS